MKQLKVSVKKKGEEAISEGAGEGTDELRTTLERLKKKGLNPMQMCQKLIEHDVPAPDGSDWSYDLVVSTCRKLKI